MSDEIKIDLAPDIAKLVSNLPGVNEAVGELAKSIADEAKSIAPVDTGAYRDGIRREKSNRPNSTVWRVAATDHKSHWIEFGIPNQDRPGKYVLRRAAQAVGAKFVDPKKKK